MSIAKVRDVFGYEPARSYPKNEPRKGKNRRHRTRGRGKSPSFRKSGPGRIHKQGGA